MYYNTALLHLKLLEVKVKQGDTALISAEKDIRNAVADYVFNVPQPTYVYLQQIGTYCDKMGNETKLEIPPLPITVVQNFGGYRAAEVNVDTHNMFEEIPSLGIAGDMVMALASEAIEPKPDFRIRKPARSVFTQNLVGYHTPIGPRRPEIAQRLAGYGITATAFKEYVVGTRFNPNYIMELSDIIGKFGTFSRKSDV